MDSREYRIDNIRALAILFVLIGHSIIIFDPVWGVYTPLYDSNSLAILKHYISLIQMPLFFSLAGYCFDISKGNKTFALFIKQKSKRLLIPFLFVGIAWMIPIRYLAHYPNWKGISIGNILFEVFTGIDSGHLWYLGTLFLIFIIEGITIYINRKKQCSNYIRWIVGIILFLVSALSSKFPGLFFIRNTAQYYFWFYFGCLIYENKRVVEWLRNKRWISYVLVFLSLILLSLNVYKIINISIFLKSFDYCGSALFVLSCYLIMPNSKNKVLTILSKNSFGLYLFHSPLLYFVFEYLGNLKPYVIVIIDVFICGGIALLMTIILRKTKVTRAIIGE